MSETEDPIYYSTNTWNLARSIAADAVDLTEQATSTTGAAPTTEELANELSETYAKEASQRDVWPFDDIGDLLTLIDTHIGLGSDTRPINEFAKTLSSRIQEDPQYEHRNDPQPQTQPGNQSDSAPVDSTSPPEKPTDNTSSSATTGEESSTSTVDSSPTQTVEAGDILT